MENVGKITR